VQAWNENSVGFGRESKCRLEICGCRAGGGKISQIPAGVGRVALCGCRGGVDKKLNHAAL